MSIFTGFEGYRDPTEDEASLLLQASPIVLDANVLLYIYSYEEPARKLALDVLESVKSQLWIPHQAMREFWRNRHSVIASIEEPVQPLERVRQELLNIVNGLRPDRERTEELAEIRQKIDSQLAELAAAIDAARGAPLDVKRILADSGQDPVLNRLESILQGRVGEPFEQKTEEDLIKEGLRRFVQKIPPGYEDYESKKDHIPEQGTGDFLLWEQTLKFASDLKPAKGFVLVTNDAKEDWRIVLRQPRKQILGIRPELVNEAIRRTGVGVTLLFQSDFYRLMAKLRSVDDATSKSLIVASTRTSTSGDTPEEATWSYEVYLQLLDELLITGNNAQADAIMAAANSGGFVGRATIYENAGFSEDRSLRRFSLPAQRITLKFVEEGLLRDDSNSPLEAVYEGPGKTIGYQVPPEFVAFERSRVEGSGSLAWIQAAEQVALTEPGRSWSVAELVDEIRHRGLRDLSGARTPEATLRRDLSLRDGVIFEKDGNGRFRLRHSSNSEE